MRLELIANLIEAMDFSQFRDFAWQCILKKGYKAVVSDGWSDGGRDIRVYALAGTTPLRIAFQCSVVWEWDSKLWEDLIKAKAKLGCVDFIYVTNRRIADAVFEPVVQRALTEEQVHLSKIDKQDLAAQILDTEQLEWFTGFVGLPHRQEHLSTASLRTEVADAFVLFSDDANDFRDRIAEHALMVALLRKGPLKSADLLAAAVEIMDYNDENRLHSAIDRLQQSGQIDNQNGTFRLGKERADHYNSTQALVAADRRAYQNALRECLAEFLPTDADLEGALARIETLLGTLVRRYADYQLALLMDSKDIGNIQQVYLGEIQSIETAVHEAGVPFGRVKEAIAKINDVAQKHPVVTRLVAGDIFRRMVPCDRSALLNAMGRVHGIKIVLEPTVVIPFLCYKLYEEAAGNRYLRAARRLFQTASALRVDFLVPDVYVEECAGHLVNAGRYINIVSRVDPSELIYSENAFVAFYAALAVERQAVPQFKDFLELFGFEPTGDFDRRVDHVTAKIHRILRNYDITIEPVSLYRPEARIRRVAEQDLVHIYHEQGIKKPPVLERHDIQVLAYMRDKAHRGRDAMLLATWDNTLQAACRTDDYEWWCIDPLHAGDLMALVEPSGRGALGVDVALLFDDVHLQLASRVWDTVVRIEKDNMYDAQLISTAVKFKNQFLARQTSDAVASQQILKSWNAAKGEEPAPQAPNAP